MRLLEANDDRCAQWRLEIIGIAWLIFAQLTATQEGTSDRKSAVSLHCKLHVLNNLQSSVLSEVAADA